MTRIYTKTGDDGTTGLIGGERISKDALRIESYGAADELNSILGVVLSYSPSEPVAAVLLRIQDDLFTIGAELASRGTTVGDRHAVRRIGEGDVAALEDEIDRCEALVEPLHEFILPGGSTPGSLLHLARTVARRCERRCVALDRSERLAPALLCYLNRLSDLLFVLARLVNARSGYPESHPSFGRPLPG